MYHNVGIVSFRCAPPPDLTFAPSILSLLFPPALSLPRLSFPLNCSPSLSFPSCPLQDGLQGDGAFDCRASLSSSSLSGTCGRRLQFCWAAAPAGTPPRSSPPTHSACAYFLIDSSPFSPPSDILSACVSVCLFFHLSERLSISCFPFSCTSRFLHILFPGLHAFSPRVNRCRLRFASLLRIGVSKAQRTRGHSVKCGHGRLCKSS